MATKRPVSPRKHPRQGRSKVTVDAIVEATARVLTQEGSDKATTNRIAEVAGVSIGSLYQYFPNKDALILEVSKRHSAEMLSLLSNTVQDLANAPIDVAVRTYVKAMLAAHAVNPALHRALMQQVLSSGMEHIREQDRAANALVKRYLEGHREQISPKNLDVAAFILVTTVESVTHIASLERPELLATVDLEDEIVGFVLRYLGVDPS